MPRALPVLLTGLAGLLALPALPAFAAGSLLLIDAPPAEATLSGGLSVHRRPAAPGSARERSELLPAFDYEHPSGFFAATDTSVGWNLAPQLLAPAAAKDWQLGLRLWPQFGRSRRESPPGIEPLGTRATVEAFANVQALPVLLLQSGLSWGSGRHHDGGQLEVGATSGLPLGDDLLAISLAATWANAAHQRGSFGVSAAESLASGLKPWQPGSGWQDWSVALSGEHKFSATWSVSGQWSRARLIGAAARSPLTQQPVQDSLLISVWRRF